MIPFMFLRSSTPYGSLTVYFPGMLSAAAMGTGDSIVVTAQYTLNTGIFIDSISFQVSKDGGAPTQWKQSDFAATESTLQSDTWNSADAGFSGAGTYSFFAIAKRVSTGAYDLYSTNTILLTVT